MNTNFQEDKAPKEGSQCICLSVVLIDSVYITGKKCFQKNEDTLSKKKRQINILLKIQKFLKMNQIKKIWMDKFLMKKILINKAI